MDVLYPRSVLQLYWVYFFISIDKFCSPQVKHHKECVASPLPGITFIYLGITFIYLSITFVYNVLSFYD